MKEDSIVLLPDAEAAYLLGCWLRAQSPGFAVTVLSSPELKEVAANVLAEAPNIRGDVHVVEAGAGIPDAMIANCHRRLFVPIALNQIPMRYRPSLMPELSSHAPLLRHCWHWGFREVRFVSLGGEHGFPIPHALDEFQGLHAGRRCFVVGNGPSLNAIDMSLLQDEITLGSNRCFLGYEHWGFPFTYWGIYDKYQIEMYHREYEAAVPEDTVKFFPVEYLPVLRVSGGCPVNSVWPAKAARAFSALPDKTYVGFTVTYMLIQIAATMGCDPIILIGTDHRYELSRRGYLRSLRSARRALTRRLRGGRLYESAKAAHYAWRRSTSGKGRPPALWGTEDAASATHFTPDYTAGGQNRFLPPEPEEAERDFDCAHAWAVANGRQILNATPGTALDSFPKVDFETLF